MAKFKAADCKVALKLALTRLRLQKQKKINLVAFNKRKVADLLRQGNDESARIEVESVVREDFLVEAYDILMLFCELLMARLGVLETSKECPPDLKEAACTLIYAAARVEVKELLQIRAQLILKLGREFAAEAMANKNNCANAKVVHKLTIKTPENYLMFQYLNEIAKQYGVDWEAEVPQEDLPGGGFMDAAANDFPPFPQPGGGFPPPPGGGFPAPPGGGFPMPPFPLPPGGGFPVLPPPASGGGYGGPLAPLEFPSMPSGQPPQPQYQPQHQPQYQPQQPPPQQQPHQSHPPAYTPFDSIRPSHQQPDFPGEPDFPTSPNFGTVGPTRNNYGPPPSQAPPRQQPTEIDFGFPLTPGMGGGMGGGGGGGGGMGDGLDMGFPSTPASAPASAAAPDFDDLAARFEALKKR